MRFKSGEVGADLEYRQQGDRERVEIGRRGPLVEIELSAEELHAEKSEDQYEQEEEEQ